MTNTDQKQALSESIATLRQTLDRIEEAQRGDDPLLALELAELLGDVVDSITWSATALARQIPGTTWTVVGGRLGISRQAAHQKLAAAV
jgi:hypothetical protein